MMIRSRNYNHRLGGLLSIFFLFLLFASCSTEIDINAPNQNVPIVYCILDTEDSIQYARVQKTYLVDQAAHTTVPHPDSIYYPGEVQISLERWRDGAPVEIIPFEPTYDVPKDSGFFPGGSHVVYRGFTEILPLETYYLYVYVKDKELVLFAETYSVGNLKVVDPLNLKDRKIALNYGQNYTCRWESVDFAGIYQVGMRLNYLETVNGETTQRTMEFPQSFTNPLTNVDYLTRDISGARFMNLISQNLEVIPGMVREVTGIDFYFISGGKEVKYYIESTAPSEGALMEKPVYSNFTHGLGLFSSQARVEVLDLELAGTTLDSLAYGQNTIELGFLDHTGDRDSTNNPKQ